MLPPDAADEATLKGNRGGATGGGALKGANHGSVASAHQAPTPHEWLYQSAQGLCRVHRLSFAREPF